MTRSSASPRPTAGKRNRGSKWALCCPRAPRIWEPSRGHPTRPPRARLCPRPPPPATPPDRRPAPEPPLGSIQTGEPRVSPTDQWEAEPAEARAARGGTSLGFAPRLVLHEAPSEMRFLAPIPGAHHKGSDPPRAPRPPPRANTRRPLSAAVPSANPAVSTAIRAQASVPTVSSRPPSPPALRGHGSSRG